MSLCPHIISSHHSNSFFPPSIFSIRPFLQICTGPNLDDLSPFPNSPASTFSSLLLRYYLREFPSQNISIPELPSTCQHRNYKTNFSFHATV
ncbi:hypothetical protein KP509_19G039300 [Ceratopteris richardii]|uniref:Uncharacterized protein n=1 Tax=Ceratopteris richardii TaxID=49495 RepID=A0A8T2SN72_CERRI|nr:hypothetical protein KP509_19G039300 [Ceratopteris richardii]